MSMSKQKIMTRSVARIIAVVLAAGVTIAPLHAGNALMGGGDDDPAMTLLEEQQAMLAAQAILLQEQGAELRRQSSILAEQQRLIEELMGRRPITVSAQSGPRLVSVPSSSAGGTQVIPVVGAHKPVAPKGYTGPISVAGTDTGVLSGPPVSTTQPSGATGGEIAVAQSPGGSEPITPVAPTMGPAPTGADQPDRIAQADIPPVEARDPKRPGGADNSAGDRPESERPLDQLLVDVGGILLPKGSIQLEPSIEYSHLSGANVAINGFTVFDAIVIGTIRVDDLSRDILTSAMTFRYGLGNRLQAELRLPMVYRRDSEVLGVGTQDISERITSETTLGDIQATLSWQPISNNGLIPATIFRTSATFPTGSNPYEMTREVRDESGRPRLAEPPTGSGFYSVQPGVNFVWRNDPFVFFSGLDYTYTIPGEFIGGSTIDYTVATDSDTRVLPGGPTGEINPGDTIGWYGGFNFAVSDRVSMSTSVITRRIGDSEQRGVEIVGSAATDARLVLGTAIATTRGRSLLSSVSVGLTEQSPDFAINLSMPLTFPKR